MSAHETGYINYYLCPNDGHMWEDEWSCMCNDRCPECDAEIEPYASEVDGEVVIHCQEVYDQAEAGFDEFLDRLNAKLDQTPGAA